MLFLVYLATMFNIYCNIWNFIVVPIILLSTRNAWGATKIGKDGKSTSEIRKFLFEAIIIINNL